MKIRHNSKFQKPRKGLGNLKLLAFLSKVKAVALKDNEKMFPITPKVLNLSDSLLASHWKRMLFLIFGRTNGLKNRLIIIQKFINSILTMNNNYGPDKTIKYLKCCDVTLQKYLARDKIKSLRTLEPNVPMPRLINGLPAIIGSKDRFLIRSNNIKVIGFWRCLFSVYRILLGTYTLKTASITAPFNGDGMKLDAMLDDLKRRNFFLRLPGYSAWFQRFRDGALLPNNVILSKNASPLTSEAWTGLFSEFAILPKSVVYTNILAYLDLISDDLKIEDFKFRRSLETGIGIANDLLENGNVLATKPSSQGGFGQLSLKPEAAGKLRVFAILDSITQSVLHPLHKAQYDLLRLIPNDGTFDQDACVRLGQKLAIENQCAFSFDLTAATDRLPVHLSATILNWFKKGLGEVWMNLLVDREFSINDAQYAKYTKPGKSLFWLNRKLNKWFTFDKKTFDKGIEAEEYIKEKHPILHKKYQDDLLAIQKDNPQDLRYSVGQPMGAYSSWANLALTHHVILQYSAYSVYKNDSWFEKYILLGDDLTIFDAKVADKYLEVTQFLGVEINRNKSIVSPNLPVFEFAKRTLIGDANVSPVAFKQLLSNSLADVVGNYLAWSERGLITVKSVLHASLSNFGNTKLKRSLALPMLATLGALIKRLKIPHRWVVESLVDPRAKPFFNPKKAMFAYPMSLTGDILVKSSKILAISNKNMETEGDAISTYPFSQEAVRNNWYKLFINELRFKLVKRQVDIVKDFNKRLKVLFIGKTFSLSDAVAPDILLTGKDQIKSLYLVGRINDWFEDNWNKELVWQSLENYVADLELSLNYDLSLEETIALIDEGDLVMQAYNVEAKEDKLREIETAKVIRDINRVFSFSESEVVDLELLNAHSDTVRKSRKLSEMTTQDILADLALVGMEFDDQADDNGGW